jgi:hypothetical protein
MYNPLTAQSSRNQLPNPIREPNIFTITHQPALATTLDSAYPFDVLTIPPLHCPQEDATPMPIWDSQLHNRFRGDNGAALGR